ncbi:MAG: hypothetical protein J0M11_03720 [Anaerolineae bacterium]|nr:hypothetical protein [Anaerolineae bacterium]
MSNFTELQAAIKKWRGFFGELHEEHPVEKYIDECKFSWRMRLAAEEHDEFENTDGVTALENVHKAFQHCLHTDPPLALVSVADIMKTAGG